MDIVKTSDFEGRRKKDRKFERLYEGPAREYALYSVPYSVKVISRVFGVNPTGEGTPSEEHVMSTPEGIQFLKKLDMPSELEGKLGSFRGLTTTVWRFLAKP